MTIDDLANELRKAYLGAADREKAVSIHLFGIRFAEALQTSSIAKVVERSGLDKSYGTEVRKAVNLAKYVRLK